LIFFKKEYASIGTPGHSLLIFIYLFLRVPISLVGFEQLAVQDAKEVQTKDLARRLGQSGILSKSEKALIRESEGDSD
jgi:hypothetical protein